MTRVKICGITGPEDALRACAAGADALGCIAVPESARFVTPETVAAIQRAAGPFVPVVLVARTAAEAEPYPADAVQFYAGAPPSGRRAIQVVRVRGAQSLDEALAARTEAILLDTYHETALGGVGKTFDWEIAAQIVVQAQRPVILAGGLTPENVAAAIARVRPYGVDVSSGVEATPGRKDPEKIWRFVQEVRNADLAR